jgi:trehalose 6-phosphate phosphatase
VRPILAPQSASVLERVARHQALLAFDFDGTLAPIVPDREAAELPEETRRLLRALALLYPCAVVSGRARADVARRLAGIPLAAVVGNHGAEAGRGPLDRTRRSRLLGWKRVLGDAIAGQPGVELEDKGFSIAVHYRHAPSLAAARRGVLRAANALEGARIFGGHAVVNVVPEDAPDKGVAIEELMARTGRQLVLYAGDDRTDEAVFRSPRVEVGVRVGRTARSAARWFIPGQRAMDDLLRALIDARTRLDGLGDRSTGVIRAIG